MRLDRAWKLVRRAAGHEQKDGMLERIFVISMAHRRHRVRDLVPGDPGPGLRHRAAELTSSRWACSTTTASSTTWTSRRSTRRCASAARARGALALEHVPPLDLSSTEWPELPDAEVVSASVYQARGRLNGYPDPEATQVRRALAERHYLRGGQIVLGNGATDLMKTAALRLLPRRGGGGRPAARRNPLYDGDRHARRRHAGDPVPLEDGASTAERLLAAVGAAHAAGDALQPERPDRRLHRRPSSSASCCRALPEHVHVLLDESYVHFQDVEDEDAVPEADGGVPAPARRSARSRASTGCRACGPATRSARRPPRTCSRRSRRCSGVNALTQATVLQAL